MSLEEVLSDLRIALDDVMHSAAISDDELVQVISRYAVEHSYPSTEWEVDEVVGRLEHGVLHVDARVHRRLEMITISFVNAPVDLYERYTESLEKGQLGDMPVIKGVSYPD